ncbi:hypothetical protein [Parasphingorhabdus halotolerans]|uniref:hypothetical protein n=1 Tax=Parasphingorhabdus halotolerans TaxID=2725558 RepID=UPI001B3A0A87|nr:hypothetical protein [Parasphingorhabdus halotolerans]
MLKFLKSDLTYSLGGGFLAGALVLFFTQPIEQQQEMSQTLSSTVHSVSQLKG